MLCGTPCEQRNAHLRLPNARPVAIYAVCGAGIYTKNSYVNYHSYLSNRFAVSADCGRLASALAFVKNLRPPQGRSKPTVRHDFKDRGNAALSLLMAVEIVYPTTTAAAHVTEA